MSNPVVLLPTFNNATTLIAVLERVRANASDIMVVNDGSTDQTQQLLEDYQHQLAADPKVHFHLVSYPKNQGKGHALVTGFREAKKLGYTHVITLDSDGQHYPEDLPIFLNNLGDAIVIGIRDVVQKNKSRAAVAATYFGNFWFAFQTWQWVKDTQSGFRCYPLAGLHGLGFITSRYEAELELLVFAAWHGTRITTTPIRVYYPPKEERVSHFRPVSDFCRIFVLNTILFFASMCYGWWSMLYNRFK